MKFGNLVEICLWPHLAVKRLTVSSLINDFITSVLPEKTVAKTTRRQMRRRGRAEKIELVFRCLICHSTFGQLGF